MAIDYKDIGQRIKQVRTARGLTQEKLSEIVGIGPSHMSHIESGSTVPSFEVFIAILNALECSADELLCKEVTAAKPYLHNWLVDMVADCDTTEVKILSDTVAAVKQSLRKNKNAD